MEPKQIYRNGSKENIQNQKASKSHKTTSVPSTDKNKKQANFSDKSFKDYDEPIKLIDAPSTPNTGKMGGANDPELHLTQAINTAHHQTSQDGSQMDTKPDVAMGTQALTQGSAQRHLSNKSDTNLSQNQSHIGHNSVMNAG